MDTKVLSSGIVYQNLPESYIRPESERPRLFDVSVLENVPVIDLDSQDRAQVVKQIGDACKSYGFFQVRIFTIFFFFFFFFFPVLLISVSNIY